MKQNRNLTPTQVLNLNKVYEDSQATLNEFLVNELPINIFLVNSEGYICWANKKLLDYINASTVGDVIGVHISQWGQYRWAAIQRVLETKEETTVEETYDGMVFSTVRKPVMQNETLIGVLGLAMDITQQKQAEQAKQAFLQNMAHDLRTPLAGIIGLASLQAIGDASTPEEVKDYGRMIHGAGEQLLELLNAVVNVIDTEHMTDSVKAEPLHLPELAKELYVLMEPSVQSKGLRFQIKLNDNLPTVLSDSIKLKRILLNLLSNAVKFTKRGKISLAVKLLSIRNKQATIEICISDTGIGIEEDKLEKIFDRFYRAHPSYSSPYSGYGIGLYLVKTALKLLGGKIKVSSKKGKGTCFTLQLRFLLSNEEANLKHTSSFHSKSNRQDARA
jgi:two-component system aerobic respiration control sensor histidine kinase ArcB